MVLSRIRAGAQNLVSNVRQGVTNVATTVKSAVTRTPTPAPTPPRTTTPTPSRTTTTTPAPSRTTTTTFSSVPSSTFQSAVTRTSPATTQSSPTTTTTRSTSSSSSSSSGRAIQPGQAVYAELGADGKLTGPVMTRDTGIGTVGNFKDTGLTMKDITVAPTANKHTVNLITSSGGRLTTQSRPRDEPKIEPWTPPTDPIGTEKTEPKYQEDRIIQQLTQPTQDERRQRETTLSQLGYGPTTTGRVTMGFGYGPMPGYQAIRTGQRDNVIKDYAADFFNRKQALPTLDPGYRQAQKSVDRMFGESIASGRNFRAEFGDPIKKTKKKMRKFL